jgi:23S rRNA pseudouridine2605 synthase
MRINKYLAHATGMSRRAADAAIGDGRVLVNGQKPSPGADIQDADSVTLDGVPLTKHVKILKYMLNKPSGYVVSRDGQGSKTIYDLLPAELHHLKPVGRLDKDSSGLLLLTNDGQLAQELTHPSFQKTKIYQVRLDKELSVPDFKAITVNGVLLDDGPSKFKLSLVNNRTNDWEVVMHEGRNRQIRRTFETLGYRVSKLHRTKFGSYALESLPSGSYALAR